MLSLQFCAEETAFIYTAILLLFLGVIFLRDVSQKPWKNKLNKDLFFLFHDYCSSIGWIGYDCFNNGGKSKNPPHNLLPVPSCKVLLPLYHTVLLISLGLAIVALVIALINLFIGLGWKNC